MSNPYSNSIFWIETEKIKPNPYQPRREFDEEKLKELADSIRQYGILQPLVVTRKEVTKDDGGLAVEYELIAGERRLRASRIASLAQVPVIIRVGDDAKMKLELAIIENLQREDLNPVDRAKAFERLASEFHFKHIEIGQKVGKSREYVSNTLRLLSLPETILGSLSQGKISEGHARPLMMLVDRPEEQTKLFNEILERKMTVREAEGIARRIAQDRARKKERMFDPNLLAFEKGLAETLGTRVQIEKGEKGGKIMIDFFTDSDLASIVAIIKTQKEVLEAEAKATPEPQAPSTPPAEAAPAAAVDDRSKDEKKDDEEEDLYNVRNFSI
ncbi:ParB/RepB/Spo0J family partition protein [Candidatus Parcubacteria bacterium]|nr:ParB/RepB/Spo0J family partition protein [Candidatus Parcubacteria bacterium]